MDDDDEIIERMEQAGLAPDEIYREMHDTIAFSKSETRPRKIRIIELRPENLNDRIKKGIIRTGTAAFGLGMTEEEIMEHIMPTDRVYIAFRGSEVIGFATANIEEDAVDFVGAAVNPIYQGQYLGKGLYSEFVMRRIGLAFENGKDIVTLRTQNPVIYRGVTHTLDDLREIGAINSYSVKKEHVRGMYGRMLTSTRPFSGIDKIDNLFAILDYEKGDTYSLEFRMKR